MVRWLQKFWNTFWSIVIVLLIMMVFVGGGLFGIIQLDVSKTYIANKIEENFSTKYNGVFTIGELDGLIPFSIQLKDVNLYPDSSSVTSVFKSDSISTNLDVIALFQKRFVVTGLQIKEPKVLIDSKSKISLTYALQKKKQVEIKDSIQSNAPFFEILAPNVTINNGSVLVKGAFNKQNNPNLPDSLLFKNIDLTMFFEYQRDERFLDIETFSFYTDNFDVGRSIMYGQVYSGNSFLEFNSFNFINEDSYANFTGRLDGIDIFEANVADQLKNADYNLLIKDLMLSKSRIKALVTSDLPINNDLLLSADFSGNIKELNVNNVKVNYGKSGIQANGSLVEMLEPDSFTYNVNFFDTIVDTSDVRVFFPKVSEYQKTAISDATINASINGDLKATTGEVLTQSKRGTVQVNGVVNWENKALDVSFSTDSLNAGNLFGRAIKSTNITSFGEFKTTNYNDISGFELARFTSSNFQVNDTTLSLVEIEASAENNIISQNFVIEAKNGHLEGSGTIDLSTDRKKIRVSGLGNNLDLKYVSQIEQMAQVIADIEYTAQFEGTTIDDIEGVIDLQIPFSTSNGDTLKPQLLYADIANTSSSNRSLRITTTALDISLEGEFLLSNFGTTFNYWSYYFKNRAKDELFVDGLNVGELTDIKNIVNQDFSLTAQLKDIGLIKQYFPTLQSISSSSRISSNIKVDESRLLFNADFFDEKLSINEYVADSIRTQLTGSFRYNRSIKDFSDFLVSTNIKNLKTPLLDTKGFNFDMVMKEDSIEVKTNISKVGQDAQLILHADGSLTDSTISVKIDQFNLGTEVYSWTNKDTPSLAYTQEKQLIFNNFTFQNRDEFFNIEGAFSANVEDSVNYLFRGVRLDRISELVNGDIAFGGNLNGSFTTRTLTKVPTIEGNIDLQALSLNNQIVGDFEISSNFNQELSRFDTHINVYTDSTIYPSYFERNDRQGQNIAFDGYVLAPVNGEFPKVDSLFYFDLDFSTIDLWIIPFLAPKVFTEMAGIASGSGAIWGNLEDYDFSIDYIIGVDDAVYMKPRFLDTYYYGQGPVTFSRKQGLVFEDIFLIDPSGGMAILSGYYNFNDFGDTQFMDIKIETDEFQFLNNKFEATAPFFGVAYGTGVVNISGTNQNPVLTTTEPMMISDFSKIELPLLDETDFEEDNKFIRFVDSFEDFDSDTTGFGSRNGFSTKGNINQEDLTFAERFTLDLQFIANNPMTVRLIFDQVTGDVITADGTGRIRIRLEDEDLSIFGQFNISGGNYQFVSGDIFTRRFNLDSGGSIIWEGDPKNARLNINAVYSARPNIRTLTTARADLNLSDPSNIQRTPMDLVLNISGSISSIENNFFFRLPNTFESRQNSTLSTQIAALNRNEDEKLLQATSFLLMGDFIPSSSINGASSLTENFSGSGAVLNPLLSNQVISPLLSNQINSLLNSDISSFDVDFNLNTYNQVDLGLALRLYNDKIIIRRDGQITGAQSNIGDLGATYKINKTFSVTAFHRQDPTFNNLSQSQDTQQGQDINGLGVEAKVAFNSWQEFFRRVGSPFRKLFGINNKEENEDENPS